MSINPARRDDVAELERCAEAGARLLKIHPPTQGVDLDDPVHLPFLRRCHDLGFVVLVHTGHEHAAPVVDVELANPKKLERACALGLPVVACHSGTGWRRDDPDMLPDFVEMVRRHENLWGDTSILCTVGRREDLERLEALDDVAARLIHGSDYPFPAWPTIFVDRIGKVATRELMLERNLLLRDLDLKRALGLGATAERGYALLRDHGVIDQQ